MRTSPRGTRGPRIRLGSRALAEGEAHQRLEEVRCRLERRRTQPLEQGHRREGGLGDIRRPAANWESRATGGNAERRRRLVRATWWIPSRPGKPARVTKCGSRPTARWLRATDWLRTVYPPAGRAGAGHDVQDPARNRATTQPLEPPCLGPELWCPPRLEHTEAALGQSEHLGHASGPRGAPSVLDRVRVAARAECKLRPQRLELAVLAARKAVDDDRRGLLRAQRIAEPGQPLARAERRRLHGADVARQRPRGIGTACRPGRDHGDLGAPTGVGRRLATRTATIASCRATGRRTGAGTAAMSVVVPSSREVQRRRTKSTGLRRPCAAPDDLLRRPSRGGGDAGRHGWRGLLRRQVGGHAPGRYHTPGDEPADRAPVARGPAILPGGVRPARAAGRPSEAPTDGEDPMTNAFPRSPRGRPRRDGAARAAESGSCPSRTASSPPVWSGSRRWQWWG
jgi:hypothetical protein